MVSVHTHTPFYVRKLSPEPPRRPVGRGPVSGVCAAPACSSALPVWVPWARGQRGDGVEAAPGPLPSVQCSHTSLCSRPLTCQEWGEQVGRRVRCSPSSEGGRAWTEGPGLGLSPRRVLRRGHPPHHREGRGVFLVMPGLGEGRAGPRSGRVPSTDLGGGLAWRQVVRREAGSGGTLPRGGSLCLLGGTEIGIQTRRRGPGPRRCCRAGASTG